MNSKLSALEGVVDPRPDAPAKTSIGGYRFKLVDGVTIYTGDAPLIANNKKFIALVALFVLSASTSLPRDRIRALLWSDSSEDKAKASLRNLLYLQKDMIPPDAARLLASQRDQILFEAQAGSSDVDKMLAAIDQKNTDFLKSISFTNLADRLLDGLDGIDPAYDEWLMQKRADIVNRLTERLEAVLDEARPDETCRLVASKLRELQPENEIACRYLMNLDAQRGNVAGALKHYETLWKYLDEEFDVEPSEPTLDLVVALKTATVQPSPISEARSNELRATIFVRGFSTANIGDGDFFVRGIRAELMNALFSVDDWVVVEPDETALPTSGGGFFELKGDVAPGLGQIRLILTLKDLSNGRIIWNDSIPIDASGWQKHSAMAVMRLAGLLIDTVETNRFQQVQALKDEDLTNYDRLMRARVLMYDWDMAKDKEAEALFRAVDNSGTLGTRAKVGLVELLNSRHLIFPGVYRSDDVNAEAYEIAKDCYAEAPQRADVNLCLAWSALLVGEHDEAIRAARMAADYSGSNPRRLASAAECMSLAGEVEGGLKLALTSEELDLGANRLSHGYRVSIHLAAKDHERCMSSAARAQGAIILGYGYAAAAAVESGSSERASEFWNSFIVAARQSWCGEDEPTDSQLVDWIIEASPLANPDVRKRFNRSIRAAAG